ncbi:molybdate ABC transporter substrate-binding protein [Azorhizobium oxalatiphilum]|uniref:molybdate ABC transporter substrate-binding protein n=1 Tax=Azorhizobium oxalatiphilum TaxID=980631 RepID=UPI001FCEFD67|nr:molybdate ABC transporter substrate-binding protein [Azorhizobium oxalatiphilum]
MSRPTVLAAALAVVLPLLSLAVPARADEATLAAGAGFRKPLTELAAAYEAKSGDKILQIYGHLGQVLAQARESDTITIVCGDKAVLHHAGDLHFQRMVRLGLGKLVVVYRKGLTLASAADVARADVKRIGIPDQAAAIYGKAGRQFLDKAKLSETVDRRLVPVATVPQVTSYVASGEVDAGFVNATDAIGAGSTVGGFVEVDPSLYDPVEVSCGIRHTAAATPAAKGFADFLGTPEAQAILTRYGL